MGMNSREGVAEDASVASLSQRKNIYEFSRSEKKCVLTLGGNGDHIHFKATIIKQVCVHVQNGQQLGRQAVFTLSFSTSPRLSSRTVPLACFFFFFSLDTIICTDRDVSADNVSSKAFVVLHFVVWANSGRGSCVETENFEGEDQTPPRCVKWALQSPKVEHK